MMREDHVLDQNAETLRKRGKVLQLLAQHALGDRDMPDHLAFERVMKVRLPAELAHLAHIVQDRAGNEQVRIDLWIKRRRCQTYLDQCQHMLKQAADPGMMQQLRCRRHAERRPDLWIVQKREHQPLQVEVLEVGNDPPQLRVHLLRRKARNGLEVGRIDLRLRRTAHTRQRDLPTVLVLRNLPLHLDITALTAGGERLCKLLPHARLERSGLVAEGQGEILAVSAFSFAQRDLGETEVRDDLRILMPRSVRHVKSFHTASAYQGRLAAPRHKGCKALAN